MYRNIIKISLVTLAIALLACETPSDNNLEQARQCSNSAAQLALSPGGTAAGAAKATQCEAIIDNNNLTSTEAQKILFGLILTEDQILSGVAAAANAKSTSVDSLNSMLPLLIANPLTDGQRILNAANNSGDTSLVYVAGLIDMATTLAQFAGLTTGSSPSAALTSIQNCNTGACQAALQTSFNSLSSAACADPVNQASTDPNNLCFKSKQITQGLGPNPTAAQLQAAIAAYAANPH